MSRLPDRWIHRFLQLAEHVAQWSKDPSTKVGAVIARERFIQSVGFNGFPAGVKDHDYRLLDRDTKLRMTIHAEENAILSARGDLEGCSIFVTHHPCARCMAKIIQSGIKEVYTYPPDKDLSERWAEEFKLALEMAKEAGLWVFYWKGKPYFHWEAEVQR